MKSGLSLGRAKLRICPKVTEMGFIIAHRIDYNWVEALRDQRHVPNKINPRLKTRLQSFLYPYSADH